ncbi:unnamed protein product [Didymodactylos carnosus]|uniref:Uncharacterized protein n=1 Tax=Didymodactylos carnosus TaxID=1234261 RepID=A0A813QST3_9BILA|nr:unnamed protein product [Didymodactylos carnosus]CAF1044135.1 unnamed protein product [Didymodactylos carnosus]CAF3554961.1 unnamed protein product [Didymodactylos carnosus]CAF3812280.1 unnamed protein product [Didymodactylos carnosus]
MDDQLLTNDAYLIYVVIGFIVIISIFGLIVILITTFCCCCCHSYCCGKERRSSYKLDRQKPNKTSGKKSKTFARVPRYPSDVDFSQLYDTGPHLINTKASHMDTSCTTIDTVVYPISPCSSFRSFANSNVNLATETTYKMAKSSTTITTTPDIAQSEGKNQNNLDKSIEESMSTCLDTCEESISNALETNPNQIKPIPTEDCIVTDETVSTCTTNNTLPTSSENNQVVDFSQHRQLNRPFSYTKNTDQSSIPHQFTQPLQQQQQRQMCISDKRKSNHNDYRHSRVKLKSKKFEETTNNIYETVGDHTVLKRHHHPLYLNEQQSQPIYETDWTQNLRRLMRTMKHSQQQRTYLSIIELPHEHYTHMMSQPNLYDMKPLSPHYFIHNPYKVLSNNTTTESVRRSNILKRLRDDSAFLY